MMVTNVIQSRHAPRRARHERCVLARKAADDGWYRVAVAPRSAAGYDGGYPRRSSGQRLRSSGLSFEQSAGADRSGDILFFFFQAEDGIRDSSVTGVQTCALPI